MRKTAVMAATATAVLALGAGAGAATATDYVYWIAGSQSPSIGRAAVDGSGANQSFIPVSGPANGLAVSSSSIYWTSGMSPRVLGKAALDGTGVNSNVGTVGNNLFSGTLAVSGDYAYVNTVSPSRNLGRIATDGSGLNTAFISDVFGVSQMQVGRVATDGTYLYMGMPSGNTIARANLDGSGLNSSFIVAPGIAGAIAAGGGYVYWTQGNNAIGRAKSDGTDINGSFISGLGNVTSSLAVTPQYIFWGRNGGCTTGSYCIARANIDGTSVTPSLITGLATNADSLAASTESAPAPTPAPAAAPAAPPAAAPVAATALRPPTQTARANANGDVAVTVALQLDEIGKYTFIFEKVTSNEMSLEQQSSSRISMQKGTKIGKRKLTKAITAANVTTTSAGAKLVMKALLKKAQAKKWNLRVIHTATDGAQSQSVIAK